MNINKPEVVFWLLNILNMENRKLSTGGDGTISVCRDISNWCLEVCNVGSRVLVGVGMIGLIAAAVADVTIYVNKKKMKSIREGGNKNG